MKPQITSDVLRGVLLAYVGSELYMYCRVALSVLRGYHGWIDIPIVGLVVGILLAVHVFVFFALLTQGAPKATFISLAILVVMPVFALDRQGWIVRERFIVRQLVAIGTVIIAYFYWRRVCSAQRSNKSLEPTPSRSEVHA